MQALTSLILSTKKERKLLQTLFEKTGTSGGAGVTVVDGAKQDFRVVYNKKQVVSFNREDELTEATSLILLGATLSKTVQ